MTDALFTWLVYRDRFPLAVPQLLGELEAPTLAAAKCQAAERWPGVAVLIQSAASHRVRPVTALPLPGAPTASQQTRARPKKRGPYQRFCQAKRAAHEARRGDARP